jgi:serine/threonine protein kinase
MVTNQDELYKMYDTLVKSKSLEDVFGVITASSFDDVEKHYKSVIRIIHPDLYNSDAKLMHMAEESTKLLNHYYQEAKDILSGKTSKPITQFNNTVYDAHFKTGDYEYNLCSKFIDDNFCRLYFGERKTSTGSEGICLKISKDIDDNFLLNNESRILKKVAHKSMPVFLENFTSKDGNEMNVIRRINNSYDLVEIKEIFPQGLPQEHAVWIMDRLLSVIGYLHINNVIHGGIEPSNILITPSNHNAILIDYLLAIDDASNPDTKYCGVNEFSAPEIDGDAVPHPTADMYSFGKVMEYMMVDERGDFPDIVDTKIKRFLKGLLQEDPSKRASDAWEYWHKLTSVREEIFGAKNQFIPFNVKKT